MMNEIKLHEISTTLLIPSLATDEVDEDEVDEVLTINIAIPDSASFLVPRFINRITFINGKIVEEKM